MLLYYLYASPYVTLLSVRLTMLLYYLYASPYVTRVIKSGRMRWAGHVARVEERRCVLVGTPEGKDLGVDGRVILKEIFKNKGCRLGWCDSGQGLVMGFCEPGQGPSGFPKVRPISGPS
jgi:hypothetical protein